MSYKGVVRREGKVYGPYRYESYRDENGNVKKRYLGKIEEKKKDKLSSFMLLFAGFSVLMLIFVSGYTMDVFMNEGKFFDSVGEGFSNIGGKITGFIIFNESVDEENVSDDAEGVLIADVPVEEIADDTVEVVSTTSAEGVADDSGIASDDSVIAPDEIISSLSEISNETLNETPVNETILNETLNETPVNETILNETLANETLINDSVINETILNETLANETLNETSVNETILNETLVDMAVLNISTLQYKAMIGRPVKWIKKIDDGKMGENISVELPKDAENISILTNEEVDIAIENIEDYESVVEETDREDIAGGLILTGKVVLDIEESKGVLTRFLDWLTSFRISGNVILEEEVADKIVDSENATVVKISDIIGDESKVAIEYYTEAPQANETILSSGKRVIVSAPSELNYTEILAYSIVEGMGIKMNDDKLKIYWYESQNETNSSVIQSQVEGILNGTIKVEGIKKRIDYVSYDFDVDGYVDYVEWIVPHLSVQVYDIIYVTKAEHLDVNRVFVSDVYSEVRIRDDVWSEPIFSNEYLRVWFERNLDSSKDITIYARSNDSAHVEVYEKDSDVKIADFGVISEDEKYQVFLTELEGFQDSFDLKVVNGSVEFDYVVDPTPISLAIPQTFNIHGRLLNTTRLPLTGTYEINFSIYDVASGGVAFWSSLRNVTTDTTGVYNIILNVSGLNFSEQYYLGLAIEGDSEMTPRMNLTSSPYAFVAQSVYVGGIIWDENMDAGGYNITASYFIGDGSLLTGINGSGDSVWDNISNVATYDGNVNITQNLSVGDGTIYTEGGDMIFIV